MDDAAENALRDLIGQDLVSQESHERGRTVYSCPDCGGALWQFDEEFGCHTGHRWSPGTLFDSQRGRVEAALVAAVRLLKEQAMLLRQVAALGDPGTAGVARLREEADAQREHADLLASTFLGEDAEQRAASDDVAGVLMAVVREMRRGPDD